MSQSIDLPALLPCPFCGGEAGLSFVQLISGSENPVIECLDCAAMAADEAKVEDAIANWNRRTIKAERT